jgi:glycosyltransferase involved in cell wall biosynthesis
MRWQRLAVHVIGEGPSRDSVIAAERAVSLSLKYLKPVAYGAPFLNLLQCYHGIVMPSLSDEQPRIVFDAAARAVPIIASDTDGWTGLRPHVENNLTGRLVSRFLPAKQVNPPK